MRIISTSLPGVMIIETTPIADKRGSFSRIFCTEIFKQHGMEHRVVQMNESYNHAKHTLRGMHYQLTPAAEDKTVRCQRGAIWDVALDLRSGTKTFGQSFGVELSGQNGRMLHVPQGVAHGYLTLEEGSMVNYFTSAAYDPARERGVRWDDPFFSIPWPHLPAVISEKDRVHRDFDPAYHLAVFLK